MSTEIHNIKYMKLREWIPFDKLYWAYLSGNPNAIPILEKTLDKVVWKNLSENPNAVHILEKNLYKLDEECWYWLSSNPNAIRILETNLDKLDEDCWYWLSSNPNAIHILEKNLDKTDWYWLSSNPNIFTYDYEAMKNAMYKEGGFVEELMGNRFHPKNMKKWNGWGFESVIDE